MPAKEVGREEDFTASFDYLSEQGRFFYFIKENIIFGNIIVIRSDEQKWPFI